MALVSSNQKFLADRIQRTFMNRLFKNKDKSPKEKWAKDMNRQ